MTTFSKIFATVLVILLTANSTFAQQKEIVLTTTQTVQTTPEAAYNVLRHLERFPEWSPFVVADPEQKNKVTGIDGTIGATFHWEGVSEKSVGQQCLTALESNKYLRMNCTITEPFTSNPVFEYTLQPTADGVEIVQTFTMQASGFSRFMMKLFGVKKHMQATNELGMERLKDLLEQEAGVLSAN